MKFDVKLQNLELESSDRTEFYRKSVIMGFWHDRYPNFSQGFESHEVLDVLTADTVNNFIDMLVKRDIQIWEIAKQLGLENTLEEDYERDINFIKNRLQIV